MDPKPMRGDWNEAGVQCTRYTVISVLKIWELKVD